MQNYAALQTHSLYIEKIILNALRLNFHQRQWMKIWAEEK